MPFLQQLRPDPETLSAFSFIWQAVLVVIGVKLAGQLSARLGQPSVLGKLLVGVILGPAVLGWLQPSEFVHQLSEIGVIFLMFLAGLETDLEEFWRSAGRGVVVAVAGVLVPLVGGWAVAQAFGYENIEAVFVGVLLVATSVSISVQTLRELGRLRSQEGVTILAAAVIDDVLGLMVLSLTLGLAGASAGQGASPVVGLAALGVKLVIFFIVAALAARYVMPPLLRWVRSFRVSVPLAAFGLAMALGFAFGAEAFGLAGIVGAYLGGLLLGSSDLKHELFGQAESIAYSFFTSFFFAGVGLAVSFSGMTPQFAVFAGILTVVAVATKLVGCGLGARLSRFTWTSSWRIGSGMTARGEVGLIVASIGLSRGIIHQELYTAMVIVALVTTLVTPPLLKLTFSRGN